MLFLTLLACQSKELKYSTQISGESQEPCTAISPGDYARNTPEHMYGVKVFTMEEDLQSVRSAAEVKQLGLNAVSISLAIPYDESGNLHYPFNPYGEKYSSIEDTMCRVGNLIHEMKSEGLRFNEAID